VGFVMVLPFSRMTFVWPVLICDQSAWVAAHVAAFSFFGAAPRQIRVDNLKTGVLRPDIYDPLVNRSYAELAEHYGVLLDPCRVRKPKDKPRVERAMPYARDSFWSGREFAMVRRCARRGRSGAGASRPGVPTAAARDRGEIFQSVERPAMLSLPQSPSSSPTGPPPRCIPTADQVQRRSSRCPGPCRQAAGGPDRGAGGPHLRRHHPGQDPCPAAG